MRILVTGASGKLGRRLVEVLSDFHEVHGCDVDSLDITDFPAVRAYVHDFGPDIVLHPAAWTDVDGCARNPEKAVQVNGYGAHNVALAAVRIGAAVLYVSTNEVFYGQLNRPYLEYDLPNPINAYGYSKMVGERAVASVNPRHYIVRISWLFSHGGSNFIHAVLNSANAGEPLRIVTDEVANPTYNDDLVKAIARLIETERFGIYHFSNEGACSRYTFARYVLDRAGFEDMPIEPISSQEWLRASVPPAYTAMSNLAGQMIGIKLRPWQEAVNAFLEREGMIKV